MRGRRGASTVSAQTLQALLTGSDAGNYTVAADYTTSVAIARRAVTLQFPGGK